VTITWLGRHRKLLSWIAGSVAVLLVATAGCGYALMRHLNDNLTQVNLSSLLGPQTATPTAGTLNILFIGADRRGEAGAKAAGDTYPNEADTLTLLHVRLSDKNTDLVSIPRVTDVHIPSCPMADGKMSAPQEGEIGAAFAIPNQDGKHDGLGAACTIKTLEQDTGLHIDHFIMSDFDTFKDGVRALGGVHLCVPQTVYDPNSGITVKAGCQRLTPDQALAYSRARSNGGAGLQTQRIARGQLLAAALIDQVHASLTHPVEVYRFIDAVTKTLTVDSQLGGITGLYKLVSQLRAIPAKDIHSFITQEVPESVIGTDGLPDTKWTARDSKIFADMKAGLAVPSSLS
jgi:LCP family protein required for cell wall assembly